MIIEKTSVDERLTRIEGMLSKLTQDLGQAPALVAIATDSVDEMIMKSGKSGESFENQLSKGLSLLLRLTDPKLNQSLNALLDSLEKGPDLISIGMDSLDELVASNSNHIEFLQNLLVAFDSARTQHAEKVGGVFGLLRSINDPDRQKALGFLMSLLKEFGKKI